MNLDVYVSSLQVEDLTSPVKVGSLIDLQLLGYWGGSLGQEVQALEAFQSTAGQKILRRIGYVEYAFSGQISEVRTIKNFAGEGVGYTEVLLDCGLPIVLFTLGRAQVSAEDPEQPKRRGIEVGQFLSGLMLLDGRISFRYPNLIVREIKARVTSIAELPLLPTSTEFGRPRYVEQAEPGRSRLPLVLGIEVSSQR